MAKPKVGVLIKMTPNKICLTKEEHLYQGRLHSVKGEYKEAIEEYKKALKIDANYKPAKINLAFISYMKGSLNKDRVASNKYMKLPKKNRGGNKDIKW